MRRGGCWTIGSLTDNRMQLDCAVDFINYLGVCGVFYTIFG